MSEEGGRSISAVALGHSTGFHVLFTDGAQLWHNLSAALRSHLRAKELPGPRFVALGPGNRWFAGYLGGRHRWGNGPPSFDQLLLREFRLVEYVTFGPRDSWFVRFGDGGFAFDGLPPKLEAVLEGKDSKFPRKAVKRMSLGPTGEWWALFEDGTALFAVLDPDLTRILATREVRELALGPEGGYLALGDFGMAWNNLDPEFEEVKKYVHKGGSAGQKDLRVEDYPGNYEGLECDEGEEDASLLYSQNIREEDEGPDSNGGEEETYLDPSIIRYTKTSIKSMLRNNMGTIHGLVATLKSGKLVPEEVPRLRVVKQPRHEFWTLDNRWLWAFNTAGLRAIPVRFVEADAEFYRRKTLVGEGWEVKIVDD